MVELVYIDEQPAQAHQVLRRAVSSNQFTEEQVTFLVPASTLDETIDMILEHHCKVLITDYRLADHKADVEFSGTDLIKEFRERFAHFPCFVTTSFAEEAANETLDINMIFPKSDFLVRGEDETSELPFFVRVRKKITEYETHVSEAENLYQQLNAKSEEENLSAEETQKLIELDNLIESFHGKQHAVESHLKEKALQPFGQLIGRTEELIQKIEAELASAPKSEPEN